MDPQTVTITDCESNKSNRRLQEVLQLAIDLNIEAKVIMSSANSNRFGSNPEVECVTKLGLYQEI